MLGRGSIWGPLSARVTVRDNRRPLPTQLAVYELSRSIYAQRPRMLKLQQAGNNYRLAEPVSIAGGLAGLGVVVNDYMDGSHNTLGIYTAELFVADSLQMRIRLDDISYDLSRYVHAYTDYRIKSAGGPWIQCLFKLPGNRLDRIYEYTNATAGARDVLADGRVLTAV